MIRTIPILLITLLSSLTVYGQQFFPGADGFSHKKISYFTLNDGSEIEGTIKDIDRKKGLIEEVKIKDAKGDKIKIQAEEIKEMYLPKSGLQKFADSYDFIHDARAWSDTSVEREYIQEGYVYFVQTDVKVKKKNRTLLMQMVNPSFSADIKVYHDPRAGETTSFSVGGIDVAGGNEKSYYVQKGEETAFRLKKKHYDDHFETLFGDCPQLMQKHGEDPDWDDFAQHIATYTENCK
jgi:hypothetical protein